MMSMTLACDLHAQAAALVVMRPVIHGNRKLKTVVECKYRSVTETVKQ
jgi:hypothetical protein